MTAKVARLARKECRPNPKPSAVTLPATTWADFVLTARTETLNTLIEQLAAAVAADEAADSEPVDPAIGQFGPAVFIWLRDLSHELGRLRESQRLRPPPHPTPSLHTLNEVAYQRGSFERGCQIPPRVLTLLRSQFLAAYEAHTAHCADPFGSSEADPSEQILRSMAELLCVPFTQGANGPQYITWLTRVYTSCRNAHRIYPAALPAPHHDTQSQHWHAQASVSSPAAAASTPLSLEVTSTMPQLEQL